MEEEKNKEREGKMNNIKGQRRKGREEGRKGECFKFHIRIRKLDHLTLELFFNLLYFKNILISKNATVAKNDSGIDAD